MIDTVPNDLHRGYALFHEGALALAEVEHAGIHIDEEYLEAAIKEMEAEVEHLEAGLKKHKTYKVWKRHYGSRTNINSPQQLGKVLFELCGYEAVEFTKGGKSKRQPKTDEETISRLGDPFVDDYLEVKRQKNLLSTYLKNTQREIVNGFIHPFFNLHTVKTFRSSVDSPNTTNVPVREPKMAERIRRCYIPRSKKYLLVEADFKGLEWMVAACFWKDLKLIEDASNPKLDVHRDMAAKCYKLKKSQVNKDVRYCGKNKFVFPKLYGSDWIKISRALWESIPDMKLTVGDSDRSIKKHLASQGIRKLGLCDRNFRPRKGTFEHHIKGVQDWFDNKFPELKIQQKQWIKDYQRRGWFPLMTGFMCQGEFSRNQVLNTPIQGPAFHILLWCLIEVVKEFRRKKMKSKVINEIHDSIIIDAHEDEFEDVIEILIDVMKHRVREHWKWIIVPLEIEIETSRTNWFEKKPLKLSI